MLLMYIRPSIVIQMYTSVCVCIQFQKTLIYSQSCFIFIPTFIPIFSQQIILKQIPDFFIHKYNCLTGKDSKKDNYSTMVTLQDT